MGSFAVRVLCAIGAATLFVTMFGSGIASADALAGKTFSDAAAWISARNGTPVIATVNGSQLEMDDCIVTSWHKSSFLDSRGKNGRQNEYLLHMNCNNLVATPGHPGNSVMTPEGAKAKREQERAAFINAHPENCQKNEEALERCRTFCNRTGLCEI